MPTSNPADVLLVHNRWATRNLIEACAKLTREQFHQPFEMGRGSLHRTMVHILSAMQGWGDLLAGVLAMYAVFKFWNSEIPEKWIKIVFFVGIADFVSAFFFGFTSAPTPIQLWSHDWPNPVIEYPTGIIPLFLVPYAIIFHILSWTEMQRKKLHRHIVTKVHHGDVGHHRDGYQCPQRLRSAKQK